MGKIFQTCTKDTKNDQSVELKSPIELQKGQPCFKFEELFESEIKSQESEVIDNDVKAQGGL